MDNCQMHSGIEARVKNNEKDIDGLTTRVFSLERRQLLMWGGVLVLAALLSYLGGRTGASNAIPDDIIRALRSRPLVEQQGVETAPVDPTGPPSPFHTVTQHP